MKNKNIMSYNKFLYFGLPLFILLILVFSGCEKNIDLSEFPLTNTGGITIVDTTYVQQYPVWYGYNQPEDIYYGKDGLIYVADTRNNRIVQLDLSGAVVGTLNISDVNLNFPRKITQDNNFDILVIADSAVSQIDTVSVIYRIKLVPVGGNISNATKKRLISSQSGTVLSRLGRKFSGISVFPDNSYIVTRRGNENSGIDPDNAIIKMNGVDTVSSIMVLDGFQVTGNGIFSIEKTTSIQVVRNSSTDFIITRSTNDFGFKVEWFVYDFTNGGYDAKFLPESNVPLIMKQFVSPISTVMDQNNSIFVIDKGLDSLYKYSSLGGIMPGSFGGINSDENNLNKPMGVTFYNKILYIADTGNNRIVRYKLSTDLN